MTKKTNSILKQALEKVKPSKEELKIINDSLKEFLSKIEKRIKILKINAEIFVGGSFAKNTVIKKGKYDVDIFIRFDKKYQDKDISKLSEEILKNFEKYSVVHGSRDYFRVKINPFLFFELIPVMKVRNPKESENITDLSYSHVRYINKKIENRKFLDEIRLAKAFCYANNCYGAESYINGFSGYSLELLVYYYGSFLKFIKAISKMNICKSKVGENKVVIDIEKQHKTKQIILMDLNSSKLQSPIILIDPTYKQRNALAALSEETFEDFRKDCKKFLKNPSIKSFEIRKTDLEKIKQNAKKKKYEFILLEAKTNRQPGDIAGSKLMKFYKHLSNEISKFFDVRNKGFSYAEKKSARYFFVVKNKKEILIQGPNITDKENTKAFKKKHRSTFIKSKRIYAKEKINFSVEKFVENFRKKNKKQIKDMYIKELKIVEN